MLPTRPETLTLQNARAMANDVLAFLLDTARKLGPVFCANYGHGCSGDHCSSLCVPACTAGGVTAGVVVSVIATRLRLGWGFWLSASAVSVLTGAMGCACVGYSGVLALVGGFAVGLAPQFVRRVFASH